MSGEPDNAGRLMLVLSRRVDEAIQIGTDITVVVLDIAEGRVNLGIVAPADQHITREPISESCECGEKSDVATAEPYSTCDDRCCPHGVKCNV